MSVDKKSWYYDAGGIETINVIKAKLTPEQFKGYLLGNLIKYSSRANFKGSFERDVEKVAIYSGMLDKEKDREAEDPIERRSLTLRFMARVLKRSLNSFVASEGSPLQEKGCDGNCNCSELTSLRHLENRIRIIVGRIRKVRG